MKRFFIASTRSADCRRGFTLVEIMVSVTILVVLMMIVANFVSLVQRTWVRSNSQVSQFREARIAFDLLTRNLSQATLNSYWENEFENLGNDSAGQVVTKAKNYIRQSELQFVCGPTVGANGLFASGSAPNYPGHGVFFQAPLGITSRASTPVANGAADTENMVNLMCGRGYFVEWGSDEAFRPTFLASIGSVPPRFRLRLMEYSPTAEENKIYRPDYRPIVDHSKQWFQDALTTQVQAGTEKGVGAVTRPVAENILCLIISPQTSAASLSTPGGATGKVYDIAPMFVYDSTLVANPGATAKSGSAQGTRHLLPPILKVSMVALDHLAGEQLSFNDTLRQEVVGAVGAGFQNAANLQADLEGTPDTPGTLKQLLITKRLNFRIFTTSIALKQSRWSL